MRKSLLSMYKPTEARIQYVVSSSLKLSYRVFLIQRLKLSCVVVAPDPNIGIVFDGNDLMDCRRWCSSLSLDYRYEESKYV